MTQIVYNYLIRAGGLEMAEGSLTARELGRVLRQNLDRLVERAEFEAPDFGTIVIELRPS